ncbi:unnamed protein product, partial [Larinioides sclopetarius]
MYCNVSSLFGGMYENMKNSFKLTPQYKQAFEIMQYYNHLYQIVHQTERALSLTALLLLSSQCLSVYLVLVAFFKVEDESFFGALRWESILRLSMGPLSITAVVLCASRISSNIRKIRTCLQMIHSSLLYNADENHKTLQLIAAMMNVEFPQMTAYGVLELKPSLILTSLGSVLTQKHGDINSILNSVPAALISGNICLRNVIQRRGDFNRSEDYFFKDWASYKKGFGDVDKDFWKGNDNIFALTNQRLSSIRFDLQATDGERRYAHYDSFWIDDENNNYTFHIKDYIGDA